MITLASYLMGRDKLYPQDYITMGVENNAKFLLHQVNSFLKSIGVEDVEVRSGWRPPEINTQVGGSPRSYHMVGRAIDIADPLGGLAAVISENGDKLRAWQLWVEDPTKTKTWVHIDNGVRRDRDTRIFLI